MLEHLPSSNGFFQKHHKGVRGSLDDVTLKNFTNLEIDDKRVDFVSKISQIKAFNETLKVLHEDDRPATVCGRKDVRRARTLKDDATAAVQKGDWSKAMCLYSKSYIFMPSENKDEIAILLANRSAALYHMEQYELSLLDIAMSISHDYPKDLKYKVLDRKARCYLALKWNKEAIMAFKETISALDDSKLPKEKRMKMATDAQLMVEILNKSEKITNPKNKPNNALIRAQSTKSLSQKKLPLPQVSGKNNKVYTAASEALDIESNDAEGRYAKANRDVTVGEIMVVEKAYCSVLLAEYSETHCQHCFKRCVAPLACPSCTNVIFCSEKCQQKAITSYHKHECPILRQVWDSGCSITCHMALRMITQSNLNHFTQLRQELNKELTGKYSSGDYKCVYNLVRHEDQRSRTDLFQRTHMAAFLLHLLKRSTFFDDYSTNSNDGSVAQASSPELESYIGSLILRNLQVLQFNAHEIFELQVEAPTTKADSVVRKDLGKSVFLGGGLYTTLALFNHSCDPGVVRYFQGTSVIVQAIKNIKSGLQISENYGPIFTRKGAVERRAELNEQYWFTCHCLACEQNWPKFEDMNEGYMRFKCDAGNSCTNIIPVTTNCQEFMIQCGLCQSFTNILKGLKALQDTEGIQKLAKHMMEKGEYGKALIKFIEELKLYDETLAPPFKDYHLCQQNIRRCLLTFGNVCIQN